MQSNAPAGHDTTHAMLIALTGGIASGKTLVSDRLASKGVPVVDTDRIAREVVQPESTGLAAVVEAFGPDILDRHGVLDRSTMRERVFADPAGRERLESILHPLIEHEARRQVDAHSDADYVLLVVPLLVESGLFEDADRVVVVDVPESIQIERLTARDGIDETQARSMLSAQAGREERLAAADDVIDNSGSRAELNAAVDELHERLTAISRRHRQSSRTP